MDTNRLKDNSTKIKPFLRWAGGKQWISNRLTKLIPVDTGMYYEPFLGGGSLYLAALPNKAVLSDLNPRLIETYQLLKKDPHALISVLERWNNDKQTYYEVRETTFTDKVHRVAQFIYLNRTCWNGLHRVNKQGKFNVPFGNNGRSVFDATHLLKVSGALKNAEIKCDDFNKVVGRAKQGDFVYFDPPYTSMHAKNGFLQYNEKIFSWQDQLRLSHTARVLAERGCHVLISNANHEAILNLYPGFAYQELSRHSILAASPKFRQMTTELLIISRPFPLQ